MRRSAHGPTKFPNAVYQMLVAYAVMAYRCATADSAHHSHRIAITGSTFDAYWSLMSTLTFHNM
jgi:hypothetical protein